MFKKLFAVFVALFFVFHGVAVADLNDGLILYYEFEGNADDSSPSGYNGTEPGNVSYVEGVLGQAALFDGQSWVDIGQRLGGYSSLSVFVWIRADVLGNGYNNAVILKSGDDTVGGFQLTLRSESTNKSPASWIWKGVSSIQSFYQLPRPEYTTEAGVWYLLGFTWDGVTHKMFVNGVEAWSGSYTDTMGTPNFNSVVGANQNGGQNFIGAIDDLRIYNRALTQEEIQSLMSVEYGDFSDVATSAVLANMYSDTSVAYINSAFNDPQYYSLIQLYAQSAYDYAEDAYQKASYAVDGTTSFWGTYAVQYAEDDLNARAEALTYIDMAVQYATADDYETAEYYTLYALSLVANADLYNGAVIWCASMESDGGTK